MPQLIIVNKPFGDIRSKTMATTEKTLNVTGMMCDHCVKHVTKALEKVDGVESADVSLEKNNAVVKLDHDVEDTVLIQAVFDAGYEATVA